jgi:dipeptidyl aminopeptidase/acylaminoacyl peptidase
MHLRLRLPTLWATTCPRTTSCPLCARPLRPFPVSPTNDTILLVSWQDYPSIARVATPFLRLAGARVEPKNHSRHDTPGGYGITSCATGFALVRVAEGKQTPVPLPTGMCPGNPVWAADGKRFAFVNIASDSVQLWIGDATTGNVHRPSQPHVQRSNAMDARSENSSRQARPKIQRGPAATTSSKVLARRKTLRQAVCCECRCSACRRFAPEDWRSRLPRCTGRRRR